MAEAARLRKSPCTSMFLDALRSNGEMPLGSSDKVVLANKHACFCGNGGDSVTNAAVVFNTIRQRHERSKSRMDAIV